MQNAECKMQMEWNGMEWNGIGTGVIFFEYYNNLVL
jgi:hypothetical protein